MSWTVPGDPLYIWIFPSAPTGTMTRFGMFCPAWKFRFEVTCRGVPDGHTVMYPAEVGLTAVTFTTTADTPAAGTPPCPVTCRDTVPNAGSGPVTPRFARVSMIRADDTGMTEPGPGAGGVGVVPRAWATVCTTVVPVAVRAASHAANWSNRVGLMVRVGSVPTAIWWNVSCTQPPPWVSALVTRSCRFCSVQVLST